MTRINMNSMLRAVTALTAAAALLAACGGGAGTTASRDPLPDQSTGPAGAVSNSSVAPNTFLTFGEQRYRLVDLLQADLVDKGEFEPAGIATDADVDQEDRTTYRRRGDDSAVYTFAPERPATAAPAFWYRWQRES